MKKLIFNDIKAKELLDIKAMRHVRGGAGGTCGVKVNLAYAGETALTYDAFGNVFVETIPYQMCDLSYDEATKFMSLGFSTKWCCDSCPQTEYCGKQQ